MIVEKISLTAVAISGCCIGATISMRRIVDLCSPPLAERITGLASQQPVVRRISRANSTSPREPVVEADGAVREGHLTGPKRRREDQASTGWAVAHSAADAARWPMAPVPHISAAASRSPASVPVTVR